MKSAEERNAEALRLAAGTRSITVTPKSEYMQGWDEAMGRVREILQPPPTRHVFGGVPFIETGEKRRPRPGEWMMFNGNMPRVQSHVSAEQFDADYIILRYVGGEEVKDD